MIRQHSVPPLILASLGLALAVSGQAPLEPPTRTPEAGPLSVSRCPGPPWNPIAIPEAGLTWLEGEELSGACEEVPDEAWTRVPSRSGEMLVHADGPGGSGRYWTITVGWAAAGESPDRGFCLTTTTLGWRTLQRFGRALPWIEDRDEDGEPELVLWVSFPLAPDASMASFGLGGWVYRRSDEDRLDVDWRLSRALATEVAAAYREPLGSDEHLMARRETAALRLESFATGGCLALGPAPD